MFLLKSIDLVALVSLLVQALVAWVFFAMQRTLTRREGAARAFVDFQWAFFALASALSVLCARFFQAHDVTKSAEWWDEGRALPTACYVAYHLGKGAFAFLLVRGSYRMAEREPPRWLQSVGVPIVAAFTLAPLVNSNINHLLVVQGPLMIAAAVIALRALRENRSPLLGPSLVRSALLSLALSWVVHALSVLLLHAHPAARYWLALNSFVDLAVQLVLGTGIVMSVVQLANARARAAEADRERLQRALESDERLRALGTLVSGVAHELNNPLTVILGYAELLGNSPGSGSEVQIIGEQAERCRGIVRNLSALARNSVHEPRELDTDELVGRVLRGLPHELTRGGARVRVEQRVKARLSGDRSGLEQVLANLLVNALQADASGAPVELAVDANEREVVLAVTDGGPGVPPALRSRLFEPFFTTKAPGKGTGLGLSIAHAIVRAHGGRIEVEDGPHGRGARFRVVLPRLPDVARAGAVAANAPAPAMDAQGRALLVVDDENAVRAVLAEHARRRGWRVIEAGSAESALEHIERAGEPDVLLCDLRMPGLGGPGLYERLERERPAVLARALFVTGDLAAPESVKFVDRCRCPVLPKPFDFDELFRALERTASPARLG
ncbi:MAG: ATP-binding protein [Planctomycetota bacterium]|nr:ATP-binding protein [Planctomycetota bacterium]